MRESRWAITDMDLNRLVSYSRLATIVFLSFASALSQQTSHGAPRPGDAGTKKTYPASLVQQGAALFRQDCSFCHGREATGGDSGPDLTRSKLVAADASGEKIAAIVRNGRPDKGMPPFDRTDQQIASLVAFIHTQREGALAQGGRTKRSGPRGFANRQRNSWKGILRWSRRLRRLPLTNR